MVPDVCYFCFDMMDRVNLGCHNNGMPVPPVLLLTSHVILAQ